MNPPDFYHPLSTDHSSSRRFKLLSGLLLLILLLIAGIRPALGQYVLTVGGTGDDQSYAIAVDASGNSYVTGYFDGTVDFDPGPGTENRTSNGFNDIFVASYDLNGNFRFANTYGTDYHEYPYPGLEQGRGIAVDASGNIYVTGVDATGTGIDGLETGAFVTSYDNTGNLHFAFSIGGGSIVKGSAIAYDIAVDASGNTYVTGYFDGTVDFDPGPGTEELTGQGGFIASYDTNGNLRFVFALDAAVGGIAVDASDNTYVMGWFNGTVDFDPGPGTENRTSDGDGDFFIASYDDTGAFRFVFFGFVGGNAIAVDAIGNSYVTGSFGGTVDFDPGPGTDNRTSNGDNDIFVLHLETDSQLPVELTHFEATTDGPDLLLAWTTATETNNAGFDVEIRTANCTMMDCSLQNPQSEIRNAPWQSAGWIEGHGTTTTPQTYTYRLTGLEAGTHRVRLKQLDFDGRASYSPELEVLIALPGTHALSTPHPNPFTDHLRFSLTVARTQQVQVFVYDALGRRVQTLFTGTVAGGVTQALEWTGVQVPNGVYVIRAEGEHFLETHPVVRLK